VQILRLVVSKTSFALEDFSVTKDRGNAYKAQAKGRLRKSFSSLMGIRRGDEMLTCIGMKVSHCSEIAVVRWKMGGGGGQMKPGLP
jgi:hypothetical protein